MKPMTLNMSKFKKISEDDHSATMMHDDGHVMKIAKKALPHIQRKQLDEIKVHKFADGGWSEGNASNPNAQEVIAQKEADALAAKQLEQKSAEDSQRVAPQSQFLGGPESGDQAISESVKPQAVPPQNRAPSEVIDKQIYKPSQIKSNDPYGFEALAKGEIGALNEQKRGQQIMAEAQGKMGASTAEAEKSFQEESSNRQKAYQVADADLTKERIAMQKDIADQHINPKRYIENMSTGSHIATGIGLILGGLGSGLTHGPNLAFQHFQSQIDRDIQSQKDELGKKENLLSHNLRATGDLRSATELTRLQSNDILSSHLKQLAGTAQSEASKGAALNAAGLIDKESAQIQHNYSIEKARMGGASGNDPARLVPLLVPKEHQAKAFGEIEAAENTKKMAASIMQSFEDAAKSNTALRTGAGFLRTPADVYALHQSMQPTFKDLEGTVRQAAMDNTFKNITPMPGDADSTIGVKREALKDYLQSKMSAPTARGYGIDLKNFNQTSPYKEQEQPKEPQIKIGKDGLKYIQRGNYMVPVGQ